MSSYVCAWLCAPKCKFMWRLEALDPPESTAIGGEEQPNVGARTQLRSNVFLTGKSSLQLLITICNGILNLGLSLSKQYRENC